MAEQYDIMWYGKVSDAPAVEYALKQGTRTVTMAGTCRPLGLMTFAEAREHAKTLSAGDRIIGWKHGTCQSVFQFWLPSAGNPVELAHNVEPPTGRKAAIEWTKQKKQKNP
jgi:hypothetical protein